MAEQIRDEFRQIKYPERIFKEEILDIVLQLQALTDKYKIKSGVSMEIYNHKAIVMWHIDTYVNVRSIYQVEPQE